MIYNFKNVSLKDLLNKNKSSRTKYNQKKMYSKIYEI